VSRPAEVANSEDLRQVGDRVEQLLDELSAEPGVRDRAEELVRLLADLYGAGLERVLDIVAERDRAMLERLAADDLIASLLLVHGLHPLPLQDRVERAIEDVRPYLGSHGGDVELLGVTETGVLRLRMLGSCDGCASSAVTLQLAVEGAVEAAAPEITGIEVVGGSTAAPRPNLIPAESLSRRPSAPAGKPEWLAVPSLETPGLRVVRVGGVDVLLGRVDDSLYAYRDACGACGSSLDAGALEIAVLACADCGARFDLRQAGRGIDRDEHLDPFPLLERDGRVEVAVPAVAVP
jgi:Fe-S cluster biogenesis protein NfuA/nitrite reductase/ring-hydroxylating ferredoxin subunit